METIIIVVLLLFSISLFIIVLKLSKEKTTALQTIIDVKEQQFKTTAEYIESLKKHRDDFTILRYRADRYKEEFDTYVKDVLTAYKETYTLVEWPDSQNYMEEPWFRTEAFLNNNENATSSSYFIPTKYVSSLLKPISNADTKTDSSR